jgi:FixJ family two-component response regulator
MKGNSRPREVDVLQWVAAGKRNKEIGAQLFITEATVKTHVKNLLRKARRGRAHISNPRRRPPRLGKAQLYLKVLGN